MKNPAVVKIKEILILIILLAPQLSISQVQPEKKDTIFNQVDKNNLKQGFWKKFYPNGNIRYTGQFINDNPTGEFRRYYEDQSLQSIMTYREDGITSFIQFYYQNGKLTAEGKYIGSKRDSIWKFYSYYGRHLSSIEPYIDGKRDGLVRKYYENGNISQEISWKGGIKNGTWKIWFSNEKLQLESRYIDGKLDGPFITYYPDGGKEIYGTYKNDKRVGTWTHINPQTRQEKTINYINGLPENQNEIDKQFEKAMEQFEKNKGKIKEPDINDFIFRKK